jgi:hypothetical protein
MSNFPSVFQLRRVLGLTFTAFAFCVTSASPQALAKADNKPGHGHGHGHGDHGDKNHNKSNPKPPKPPKDDHGKGDDKGKATTTKATGKASFSVAEAVTLSSQSSARALNQGSMVDRSGRPLPARSQLELLDVLSDRGAPVGRLTAALAPENNRQARGEALTLANSMRGLANDPSRLPEAAEAYNSYIGNSSAAFLSAPPPELLTVQAVLLPMVDQAMGGSDGTAAQ